MNRRAAILLAAAFAGIACGAPVSGADPVGDGQWYVRFLRLDEAHKISQGNGIVVAVIDTGIDATHPDLAGSVIPGTDTSHAGPGDGLTDTVGHGTGMAGLIAGHGRIRGVAPKATVMPIRAETTVSASSKAIGAALNWAVNHGAAVVSISLTSPDADEVLRQAVENALRSNVIVVAAAGDKSRTSIVGYPAAYPGVVAVGGVDPDGEPSPTAVSGEQIVLAAPSDRMSAPWLRHERAVLTGTSNAAALVAGAAALVRARYPQLPAGEVVHRLTATAVDRGPSGKDNRYGHGVLDIVAALTESTPSSSVRPAGARFPFALSTLVTGLAAAVAALILGATVIVLIARRLPGQKSVSSSRSIPRKRS